MQRLLPTLAKAEVAAEAARPKVEEESANKAKANAQAEVAKAGTKTKQLEILSEQLQQIHKLDVPAAEKANMLQRLRPPTE